MHNTARGKIMRAVKLRTLSIPLRNATPQDFISVAAGRCGSRPRSLLSDRSGAVVSHPDAQVARAALRNVFPHEIIETLDAGGNLVMCVPQMLPAGLGLAVNRTYSSGSIRLDRIERNLEESISDVAILGADKAADLSR